MRATRSAKGSGARACAVGASALAVGAMLGACQPPLEEVWQLRDFRVLGVRATTMTGTAEPGRGEAFTLDVVTADVQPRPVSNVFLVLAIPAVALTGAGGGTTPDAGGGGGGAINLNLIRALIEVCTTMPQNFGVFQCGPGASAVFRVPAEGGAPDGQGRESLTVIGYACAGGTITLDRSNTTGPLGPLGSFRCAGEGARGWQYQKTVMVRPTTLPMGQDPNANPRITEVRFGPPDATVPIAPDAPMPVARCTDTRSRDNTCPRLRFEVGFSPESRQMYTAQDPLTAMPVPRVERLTVGFVADRGVFAGGFRTDSSADPMSVMDNDFRAPAEPGPVRVIVYASDGRGGFDVAERVLLVQ